MHMKSMRIALIFNIVYEFSSEFAGKVISNVEQMWNLDNFKMVSNTYL